MRALVTAAMACAATASIALAGSPAKETSFVELKPVSQNPGVYTPTAINTPVFAIQSQLKPCGTFSGRYYPTLTLSIAADGRVSTVAVSPQTGFSADTIACIDKVMRQATFPPRKGTGTTAKYAMLYR